MSQSVAVSVIQERARTLCDLPAFTSNTQVTTSMALDYVKAACVLLGGLIKEHTDEQLLTTSGTVSTVANVSTVTLPTNFSDLVRIAWQRSPSEREIDLEWANVDQFEPQPATGYGNPWSGGAGTIRYRLMGAQQIELYPTPPGVYTLRLYYTTGIYVAGITDQIVCRDGWDLWLTYQVCLMFRARQQKDASEFNLLLYGPDGRSGVEGAIRKQLKRDRFGAKRIRDRRGSALPALMDTFRRRDRWP